MTAGKRKGTAWESAVVTYLRSVGFPWADRVPLSGALDRGDVTLGPGSPAHQCKNTNRQTWAEDLDEATAQAVNAAAPFGVVWRKRRGKGSPADGYVLMSGATYVRLLREAGYAPEQEASA